MAATQYLPSGTRWIAVFKADVLRQALREVATTWPRAVLSETPEAFLERVRELWGVSVAAAGPDCVLADVEGAGVLLACPGGEANPPRDARSFAQGTLRGYDVARGDLTLSVAVHEGRLLVGTPAAVRQALDVARKEWPSLARRSDPFKPDTAFPATNRYREAAVYFVDPHAAPWCDSRCTTTAIYADPSRGLAVVARTPGLDAAPQAIAMEALARRAVAPFDAIRDSGSAPAGGPIPPPTLKRADLAARTFSAAVRGEVATLTVEGDVLALGILLESDLVMKLFGKL
jgi:hypothetical protein